ncbi:MAG: NAD-dependent epimerase/dehydratase family protein, partial [Candidatus Omnitrophica bacterium]|nr:NAD-dependent epimerase/dehydratase family protein [Candidatus Omnitrophota bacterium]
MEEYKKYYEGKKILVTGGAGAIGSNLVRTLGQLKANLVIILDDLSSSKEWNVPSLSNVLFVKGSI